MDYRSKMTDCSRFDANVSQRLGWWYEYDDVAVGVQVREIGVFRIES